MSRKLRIQYPGALYHVTVRGNERRVIFMNDHDRNVFLIILIEVIRKFNLLCYAYCLMDNHFHLLVETPDGNIGKAMHRLNGLYAQYFNATHNRVGHLFQGRYHTSLIQKETHLLECARYLVLNPVRAGLVKNPGDWRWSSYNATASARSDFNWLQTGWILSFFSQKTQDACIAYKQFVQEGSKQKTPNSNPKQRNRWIKFKHQYSGESLKKIASIYDLNPSTVGKIVRRIE